MTVTYFAYGSNLCLTRLRSRVPGACFIGLASLDQHEARWHKRSNDGSGKLSVIQSSSTHAVVLGALFAIPTAEKGELDRAEGLGHGYVERRVKVQIGEGTLNAQTYVAAGSHIDDSLRPYSWYRDLVVGGAKALGLLPTYVAALGGVEVWNDPDPGRESRERMFLPCYQQGTERFLREDFLRLTIAGALQRSGTYAPGVSEPARSRFRLDLKKTLHELAARYEGQPVSDHDHLMTIEELCQALSERHRLALRHGRFRVGVAQKALNLFLKYLWCVGWICEPPHCPFDRIVIELLPPARRLAWTQCDDIEEYQGLVDAAREMSGGKSLAVWELEAYAGAVSGTV